MRNCTILVIIIHVAKTKALISFAVTAKLICVFVFAYAFFLPVFSRRDSYVKCTTVKSYENHLILFFTGDSPK